MKNQQPPPTVPHEPAKEKKKNQPTLNIITHLKLKAMAGTKGNHSLYGLKLKTNVQSCCDVAVAHINYPSFKHNTQDSIEQARGRSHEEGSSQIFMLDDMQFRGSLDVI